MRGLVHASLAMQDMLDQKAQIHESLRTALALIGMTTGTFWAVADDRATCQMAVGGGADAEHGRTVPLRALESLADDDLDPTSIAAPIVADGRTLGFLQATRSATDTWPPFTSDERAVLALIGESVGGALVRAARIAADDRSGDIQLVQELSREIGSSLDLDRVLQTVVNIAAKALPFDRGALALYENGTCDIRAVAGVSTVDSSAEENQDLAFRAAWAAGTGESFYVGDRDDPTTDTERIFLQFFRADLEKADAQSGLYMPLRDEEGIVGILLFEAKQADFASERQRDLAIILANQATVAIRNAKLYGQVPLAEALGAFSAKRAAFFAIPRHRRMAAVLLTVGVVAAATLVRWPLRVVAEEPVFRAGAFTDVRALVPGTVDQVLIREGSVVAAGQPIARLRDIEARAARANAVATLRSASRMAVLAASRGDAAEQRLQSVREDAARAELALRDEEFSTMTIRAPASGIVLTPRPELLLDSRLQSGTSFVTLGRTDSLELEFLVTQRDINRVQRGQSMRIRMAALPQATLTGTITMVGALPQRPRYDVALSAQQGDAALDDVMYPVRAMVDNPDGILKPGMAAHARVLTAPESLASRLLRTPVRVVRLFWWRIWSWV